MAENKGKTSEKTTDNKLVRMIRSKELAGNGPTTADVHPDEVDNYKQAGWEKE
jgi:hypothetical protein